LEYIIVGEQHWSENKAIVTGLHRMKHEIKFTQELHAMYDILYKFKSNTKENISWEQSIEHSTFQHVKIMENIEKFFQKIPTGDINIQI